MGINGRVLGRRAFLTGGGLVVAAAAAGLAVEEGVLPGRVTLHRALGLDGPAGVVPSVKTGELVSDSFVSKARLGKTVGWAISYPPGAASTAHLPVVVVLHGYGGSHSSAFGSRLGLDHFLADAVKAGAAPFAIASVDGGNTYWHRRSTGEDAAAMVTDEFLPLLAARGLDTSRIGLLGWSMGAYGALLLGGRLGTTRVAAVAAESVAIWPTAGQAAGIAFDGAADYAANTLYGRQHLLDEIPVRLDCGTGDGFLANDRAYAAGLTHAPSGGFSPGGHNYDYWRRMAPGQLAFLGQHLTSA